jgi:hypothetical protein
MLTVPYVRATRNALNARTFAAAWAEGGQLTLDAACALAFEIEWPAGVQSLSNKPALVEVWRITRNLVPQPTLRLGLA